MPLNILLLTLIAVTNTTGLVIIISRQNWGILKFLKKESAESLERKLFSFDEAFDAKIITDEDGNVTSVNKQTELLFGYKENEFKLHGLKLIVPDRFWTAHTQGIKRQKGIEMEDRIYHVQAIAKTKREIPLELKLRKRKINDDFFYLTRLRDVTKEHEVQQVFEDREAVLLQMIDILNKGEELGSTGSWFWDLTSDEDVTKTKLYTSKGYNKIMGLENTQFQSATYLKSRVWNDNDNDEDVTLVNAALDKAYRGESYDITYRMNRSSDFKVILVRSIVKPVKDENGIVIGMNGSTRLLQTLNIKEAIAKK